MLASSESSWIVKQTKLFLGYCEDTFICADIIFIPRPHKRHFQRLQSVTAISVSVNFKYLVYELCRCKISSTGSSSIGFANSRKSLNHSVKCSNCIHPDEWNTKPVPGGAPSGHFTLILFREKILKGLMKLPPVVMQITTVLNAPHCVEVMAPIWFLPILQVCWNTCKNGKNSCIVVKPNSSTSYIRWGGSLF